MTPLIFGPQTTSNILGLSVIADIRRPIEVASDLPLAIYYGGWTLRQLEKSPGARKVLQAGGFNTTDFSVESGYYALRLVTPSPGPTWDDQLVCPPNGDGWISCPINIAAIAMVLVLLHTATSLLGDALYGSCAEQLQRGHHIALTVADGIVVVTNTARAGWDGNTFPTLRRIEAKKLG